MKYLLTCCIVVASLTLVAQTNPCLKLKVGSTWEMGNVDSKGRSIGKTTFKVSKIDSLQGKYTARVFSLTTDEKGKKLSKMEVGQSCTADTLWVDMKNHFSVRDNVSYKWRTDPSFISYPSNLEIGMRLDSAVIVYTAIKAPRVATQVGPTASKNNQTGITATFIIDQRVVEAREEITTAAGTFVCFKIKSRSVLNNQLDYAAVEHEQVEWFAPGIGIVKSEKYRKAKKMSTSQLIKKSF